MNFLIILLLFFIRRVLDFLILYLAPKFIPYLGFFPYKEILPLYHLPEWITKLANFDGVHYLLIAQQGYMTYEQAYFPLYSFLIKLLTPVFLNNAFIASFFISNVSFLLGLWVFSKYLSRLKFSNANIFWIIILLLTFPTSFFFSAIYTEGLFFFLFISSLFFLKKRNYLLAGIFAFFASLTRLVGVFLIIPIGIHILSQMSPLRQGFEGQAKVKDSSFAKASKDKQKYKLKIKNILLILNTKYLILILSPLLGLLSYCIYLWKTTGDPIYFLSSQPIFGAHRSTNLILLPQVYWRYLKILFTANHDFQFYVSLSEMIMFTFVFVILLFDLFQHICHSGKPRHGGAHPESSQDGFWSRFAPQNDYIGLWLFSLANLILPTLTGTFSSIPRYALFSLSLFIFLGSINNKLVKIIISIIFILCHVVILGLFGQGYFIS